MANGKQKIVVWTLNPEFTFMLYNWFLLFGTCVWDDQWDILACKGIASMSAHMRQLLLHIGAVVPTVQVWEALLD